VLGIMVGVPSID